MPTQKKYPVGYKKCPDGYKKDNKKNECVLRGPNMLDTVHDMPDIPGQPKYRRMPFRLKQLLIETGKWEEYQTYFKNNNIQIVERKDKTQKNQVEIIIPENKKINDLLQEFRSMKMHLAVVVDEYGGASGVITLEDILEEIVGDITDEFDDDEIAFEKLDDFTYIFEGRTTLNDFYKVVGVDGKDFEAIKGDAETLVGFINEQTGRIMKNKEFILQGNFKLIVESSDKRRVKLVKVLINTK
jgi:CBS domain containing-hemolysin-like protein